MKNFIPCVSKDALELYKYIKRRKNKKLLSIDEMANFMYGSGYFKPETGERLIISLMNQLFDSGAFDREEV